MLSNSQAQKRILGKAGWEACAALCIPGPPFVSMAAQRITLLLQLPDAAGREITALT